MKQRILGAFLALALLLTLVPASVSAQAADNGNTAAINEVSIDGASARVLFTTADDGALFVGLYSYSGKMTAVRTEKVFGAPDEQVISVKFDAVIDENSMYVKAFLLGVNTFAPLCASRDSKFNAEQYALIERITIETTFNNVTTKTASVLGTAETDDYDDYNDELWQTAYNQAKAPVGTSSWDAQAQLRLFNGTRRTVTLDDSKNYRTSAASDNAYYSTAVADGSGGWSNIYDAYGADVTGMVGAIKGNNGNGNGDGNWIAEPFTAGHIVRISSSDVGYSLDAVNNENFLAVWDFSIQNRRLFGANYQPIPTPGGAALYADAETHFVIDNISQSSYKSYVGIKYAPDVRGAAQDANGNFMTNAAYIYHENGLAKLVFVTSAYDVSDYKMMFISANSARLIHSANIGDYYLCNAVINGQIQTVKVHADADLNMGRYSFSPGKAYAGGFLNDYVFNSDNVLVSGSFDSSSSAATYLVQGVSPVDSKEIRVNTHSSGSYLESVSKDIDAYYVSPDGEISQIALSQIAADTENWVYYVKFDDEITDLVIVDHASVDS